LIQGPLYMASNYRQQVTQNIQKLVEDLIKVETGLIVRTM